VRVKSWTFNTCALSGFACSSVAVILLVLNAVTGASMTSVLLPVAIVALVIGGAFSVRAHLLWIRGRGSSLR
jgi:hypothetical protein